MSKKDKTNRALVRYCVRVQKKATRRIDRISGEHPSTLGEDL